MVRILGIETSCDETAIGIVQDGRQILANVVSSSQDFHKPYGGVVPEIAARVHVEVIWQVCEEALRVGGCSVDDVDAIAVTQGPGLPGALLSGLAFAKGLALTLDRPLIPINHLAAHLYAAEMIDPQLSPPYVGLVVSGGHTLLCIVHPDQRFEVLGETQDDAVGEAFDKVAKLLGLGYPGGPVIDRLSDEGQSTIAFPRSRTKDAFAFSFSGLKAAVYNHVKKQAGDNGQGTARPGESERRAGVDSGPQRKDIADIAASFQEAAVEALVAKTIRACQRTGIRELAVGGGVACNRRLRARLAEAATEHKIRVVFPPPVLCVDNGAMIAGLACEQLRRGRHAALSLNSDPALALAS